MGTGTFLGNPYEALRVTLGAIFGVLTSLPVGEEGVAILLITLHD